MINPIPGCKLLAKFALPLSLLVSSTGYAQTPPDAGQILRELQQPALGEPQPELKLNIEEPVQDQTRAEDIRFMVNTVNFSGNRKIPTEALQALVADLPGSERSLSELTVAAARITAYYRTRGYPVARAYLPAQEIKDGVVLINIIEGRIAKLLIDNQSRLSDERAKAFLNNINEGDVIYSSQIDRSLLLLNDTAGVESVRATLQPGVKVGTSDLLVELKPARIYSGTISLDNHGTRYVGQYQLKGRLVMNSPFNMGDQISLVALASNLGGNYGSGLAYKLPVGNRGLYFGAEYIDTHFHLGKELESLQAYGKVNGSRIYVTYPYIRSQQSNLIGTFMWERIEVTDPLISDRSIELAHVNAAYDHRDALGGGGVTRFELSLKLGRLDIASPVAQAVDNLSARSNGEFTRLTYSANRVQRLKPFTLLSFSLSGQQASKNLNGSEKFTLGGANGVRAYPQGEGVGDQGYLAKLELMHDFTGTWQGTLFYDAGSVTINRNPYGAATTNSRSLSGVGLGLNANVATAKFSASLAWSTGGGDPTSIPASAITPTMLWMQISKSF